MKNIIAHFLRALLLGLCLLVIQNLLHFYFHAVEYAVPNLLIIVICYVGFFDLTVKGAFTCWFLGVLLDLSISSIIGPWAGSFAGVFLILAFLSRGMFVQSWFSSAVVVFLACLVSTAMYASMLASVQNIEGIAWLYVPFEALSTAIVSPLVFSLSRFALDRRQDRLRGRRSR